MRKYVQNIDRLFAGQTANALVLSQVDEDFPVLLPSVPQGTRNWNAWIQKFKKIHSDFDPGEVHSIEELNEYVVDFNLRLQTRFKDKAHAELYMMDDTGRWMKPSQDSSYGSDREYVHCLNGISEKDGSNLSQTNVLFPFRKMMQKSLFQRVSNVLPESELDQLMETSRIATLQGRCSYRDSVRQVVQAGNNLYALSPTIPIGDSPERFSNNATVMLNGLEIPTNISLFQPSQDQYSSSNLAYDDENDPLTDFREWYEEHDGKTWMQMSSVSGGNLSTLRLYGADRAYGLDLATYGPSDLMSRVPLEDGGWKEAVLSRLNSKGLQNLKAGEGNGKYISLTQTYILNNGDAENGQVGFRFNLYDNFMTGSERVIGMTIPRSRDFNNLVLKFQWSAALDDELGGDLEYVVEVNGKVEVEGLFRENEERGRSNDGSIPVVLRDSAVGDSEVKIVVRLFYDVDYVRRNHSMDYRNRLAESGLTLWNIKVEDQQEQTTQQHHLTFGAYVNEQGIGEDEFQRRMLQFWRLSKIIWDVSYQSVLETSIRNVQTNGVVNRNNYQTGDMSGDLFLTKNVLDKRYDMNLEPDKEADETFIMRMAGRDYINLLSCSNQLALVWRGADAILSEDAQLKFSPAEDELKYQMVETVRNINRFESSIKHKSNVFSVVVENSNLAEDRSVDMDEDTPESRLENFKRQLRNSVTQFVRNACKSVSPVHTQLFDVQFT